jgi:hypothetical protein
MANTTATANTYKAEILQGIHLAADVYKLALIKAGASGTYGAGTTNVGTPGTGVPSASNLGTDEVVGTGYTSGGVTLSGFSVTETGSVARLDFTSPSFSSATISATGAIIYNSTRSGKVVGVYDFGGTITSTNGTFAVNMPAVGDATSLLRIA